jgi:hypothetical protein
MRTFIVAAIVGVVCGQASAAPRPPYTVVIEAPWSAPAADYEYAVGCQAMQCRPHARPVIVEQRRLIRKVH